MKRFPAVLFLALSLHGQSGSFPLESVLLQGSDVSRAAVLAISGLQVGAPIDKPAIDAACAKLQESGIFESINYRYAPTSKGGVALTLSLIDSKRLTAAAIDVPGLNEGETWDWLKSQFPNFDHRIPDAQGAQEYLAKSIEKHLGDKLRGEHVVPRMEDDLVSRHFLISFQPENLPKIGAISLTGQQEIPAEKLKSILAKYAQNEGYTDRGFRQLVDLNLRPVYEDHGMYRVKFPGISMTYADGGAVAVTVAIEEGPKYKLGAVTFSGDAPSTEELLQAANFKRGELANWTEIQQGIYATSKPLNRKGYLNAQVRPERSFNDEQHLLNLNLAVAKGPQFYFGAVRFQGLSPDLETRARSVWTLKQGEPLDLFYPSQFVADFSRKIDLRQFKKTTVKNVAASGEHVMDVVISFQ